MRPVDQHHLRHVLQVAHGDEVAEAEEGAQRDRQRQHHGEAGVDRAGHEVGREDRGVPAGDDADREVEGDDGVDRDDERRRQPGEQHVGGLVVVPVGGRAAPAHRPEAVDDLPEAARRAVAQGGEVGDQADVPEEQRDGGVGRDREDVPDERAPELRPHAHGVGVGEEPVGEPGAPEVEHRVEPGAGHGEERHRLGEAVDRGPPLLAQQQEDRRDQRAGVADADPPDEVDDVEAPADRDVDAPDPHPLGEEDGDRPEEHHDQREGDAEAQVPPLRHAGEDDRADLVGDRGGGVPRRHDRRLLRLRPDGGVEDPFGDRHRQLPCASASAAAAGSAGASAGLGLVILAR